MPIFQSAFAEEAEYIGEVTVTGTREAEPAKEIPAATGAIKGDEIQRVRPTHPAEVMNRVPGVWVSSTGGEGHTTSIRQPLTTSPVYLFLEDGVPIRSTGFFNHNALYEVNVPGAGRIEVIKGTGTALYGSDSIGGTINIMTRPAPLTPEVELNPEIGSYDWVRLLASGGNTIGDNGYRLDLNVTHSGGWRERKLYDRQSATLRWDHVSTYATSLKTILSYSGIEQETSGGAPLSRADYDDRPWYNYQTFDYRNVDSFRLSTDLEHEIGDNALVSVIPYFRKNRMELLPEWAIFKSGADPSVYMGYESTTDFYSLGLLAKYRRDFAPMRTRFIIGVDLDYSPGQYEERRLDITRDTSTLKYTGYSYATSDANNYDFDATFIGISPYTQIELSPAEKLRLTLGARYDDLAYDYTNNLTTSLNRPGSTYRSWSRLSPKAGATYELTDKVSLFASYNQGFRIPSTGDIFRAGGTAATAVDLDPVKVYSYETGLKGALGEKARFETSVYYMEKKDDIVTFNAAPGDSQRLNAGKTVHKGIEVGLEVKPVDRVGLGVSYSYSMHEYDEWRVSGSTDFSGKEMPVAPRHNLSVRVDFTPAFLNGGAAEIEWVHLGSYWLDDANTEKYGGHDLVNLRTSYYLTPQWEVYLKATNLLDRHYAEKAAKSSSGEALYTPGTPQSLFAGLVYRWKGE
ncbi:MAG: hypothetical protein A2V21_304825 [Deltaproteobacteria bacterium GWC2_55_46]|nr:MAG: hypothetical protein A2Z79_08630 [Deltaproteobacteria bacterium GWA2_55_82]OGQ64538.1 MAG: hypothetical protein A3I81_07620 [Deltaproteobacteria bacterium RIFCSPLOWO2_02_FULL_55_12]OIJ75054.1 MAG: hypothetical protein A2V21_304825 [Deltaproteobacteria bacterium GWC2_55_46]